MCSIDGNPPVQTFANPVGAVWEVLTVRDARGLVVDPVASTEFTWFAGYAWSPAYCSACRLHLGWVYDAVAGQRPPRFYGLVRAHLAG